MRRGAGIVVSIAGSGGGIFNSGTLTVTGSTLSGNEATGGGGFHAIGTAGAGGGIYNAGTLTITGSALSGNAATGGSSSGHGDGSGGGIFNTGGLMVTGSTLSSNAAHGASGVLASGAGSGGGIFNTGDNDGHWLQPLAAMRPPAAVASSSPPPPAPAVASSTPAADGHWLHPQRQCGPRRSGGSSGNGIFNTGTLSVIYVTIADNSVSGDSSTGGGIAISTGPNTEVAAIDSIFKNPQGGNVSGGSAGNFHSLGHNLFSDAPGFSLDSTDLINTDPLLESAGR